MQRVRLPLTGLRVNCHALFGLRTSAGITQRLLAERSKISEHWYRVIEHGVRQPSQPVAQSIADALGCKIEDFCDAYVDKAAEAADAKVRRRQAA